MKLSIILIALTSAVLAQTTDKPKLTTTVEMGDNKVEIDG
jgi:hypothetical protein